MARPAIFISYSHQDRKALEQFQRFLRPLERDGIIDSWDDTRIEGGDDWKTEIDQALAAATTAVLFISQDFLASEFIYKEDEKLAHSPRAKLPVARRTVCREIAKLKLAGWLTVRKRRGQRQLYLVEDAAALAACSKLDGCYAIRTDLPTEATSAQTVHERYRDLAQVEQGFRTCKTTHLELRPWFVTCEASTRGHALVVMLAYKIVRYLSRCWQAFDIEVVEALEALQQITLDRVQIAGYPAFQRVPTPRRALRQWLEAAAIELPQTLPHLGTPVVTRKNISESRK